MVTERQSYLRHRARQVWHLFCGACGIDAPRQEGGLCDACAGGEDRRHAQRGTRPPDTASGWRRPAV